MIDVLREAPTRALIHGTSDEATPILDLGDDALAATRHAALAHCSRPARADRVTATDRFTRAVSVTARRCAPFADVTVESGDICAGPPAPAFDLAVLGEVLHYFDAATVVDVVRRWHQACDAGGHVVLVHFRTPVAEHVLTGDDVHGIAADLLGEPAVDVLDPGFRLGVFEARRR